MYDSRGLVRKSPGGDLASYAALFFVTFMFRQLIQNIPNLEVIAQECGIFSVKQISHTSLECKLW